MLIEQEVSGDIEELTQLFKHSPRNTELAIDRTMRKLGTWAEREVLRGMSRELKVTQKLIKEFGRVKTYLNNGYGGNRYLTVWIGTMPVGAHRFGKTSQTAKGVRVGRHSFWDGAFLMRPVNADRDLIFERRVEWSHKWRKSKVSGRWMWMGLPIYSHKVGINNDAEKALKQLEPKIFQRFSTLLHQELNYAFNVEPRKADS